MIEPFSAGYYLARLRVEPHDGDRPVVARDQHEAANRQVYATGEGLERLDYPLVVKVDHSHLPVFPCDDVSEGVLALPESVLEAIGVENPPSLREVFVARAGRAARLLEWATPYAAQRPDIA